MMRSESWLSPSISLTSSTSQNHYSYHYHQMHQNQWQENEPLQGTAPFECDDNIMICVCVRSQVLVKRKCCFFSKRFFFAAAQQKRRSEQWLWCDPAFTAPPKRARVYNWTKAGTHTLLWGSKNRRGRLVWGGEKRVISCSVNHTAWKQSPPCSWRQWHQWDKRTETPQQGRAGETAAVQSSGLATDSFRKTQTPWNEELRIQL